MLLKELFNNNIKRNIVEFNFSSADYENNSDRLTYHVTNLPVRSDVGNIIVKDAGTVILNVTAEELAEKLKSVSNGRARSADGIDFGEGSSDFRVEGSTTVSEFEMRKPYTLLVDYTLDDGSSDTVELTFDESVFKPSDEFLNQYARLTEA